MKGVQLLVGSLAIVAACSSSLPPNTGGRLDAGNDTTRPSDLALDAQSIADLPTIENPSALCPSNCSYRSVEANRNGQWLVLCECNSWPGCQCIEGQVLWWRLYDAYGAVAEEHSGCAYPSSICGEQTLYFGDGQPRESYFGAPTGVGKCGTATKWRLDDVTSRRYLFQEQTWCGTVLCGTAVTYWPTGQKKTEEMLVDDQVCITKNYDVNGDLAGQVGPLPECDGRTCSTACTCEDL